MQGKTLYNSTNAAAIAASAYWTTDLREELKQNINVDLLPANAIYIKSVNADEELQVFLNDVSGDSYLISAGKDLFLSGINIWSIFIKNNGTGEIAIGDVTLALYKTSEV